MVFHPTPLQGAYTVELEKREDSRGFFARFFCREEFRARGLSDNFVQANSSLSHKKATLRGLHYQLAPHAESKLVRCIQGSVWDCIVDLRPESPTFRQWFGTQLSAKNRLAMYVPKGFAHGFISLADHSEVFYLVDEFYSQTYERGLRWNDPSFGIAWPMSPNEISDRDQSHPDFSTEPNL